jgi:hypothetical protein
MGKTHPMPAPSQWQRQFLKRPAYILGLLLFVPLCRPIASATEVYAYLGADYASATGLYTTSDYISGEFTTSAPIPPNFAGIIVPMTYAFGDGFFDWTNNDSTLVQLQLQTDRYGTILFATLTLFGDFFVPTGTSVVHFQGEMQISNQDVAVLGNATDLYPPVASAQTAGPGKWGPNFDPPASGVPEPASAVLSSAALLAFAFRARTRLSRSIQQFTPMHR